MSKKEASPAKGGVSLLPTILIAIVVAGGAAFWWQHHTAKRSEENQPAARTNLAAVLHLETFTLNIDDPDQRIYLRVGIDLGLNRDPKSDNGGPPTAVVRDTILNVLMATKADEITTAEGKNKLKERIVAALQQRVPELAVREVYFTDFLIQR